MYASGKISYTSHSRIIIIRNQAYISHNIVMIAWKWMHCHYSQIVKQEI